MSIYVVGTAKTLDDSYVEQYGGEHPTRSSNSEFMEGEWPTDREAVVVPWDPPECAKAEYFNFGRTG